MCESHALLWESTGSPRTSACHQLSAGNVGHDVPATGRAAAVVERSWAEDLPVVEEVPVVEEGVLRPSRDHAGPPTAAYAVPVTAKATAPATSTRALIRRPAGRSRRRPLPARSSTCRPPYRARGPGTGRR